MRHYAQSLVRLPIKSEGRETVSSDAIASLRRLTGHEMLALTALENATAAPRLPRRRHHPMFRA